MAHINLNNLCTEITNQVNKQKSAVYDMSKT